ncbi:MAG: YciI family protein [Planctomycetota bacterium]
MRYLLMIADAESAWDDMPESEQHAMLAEYHQFGEELEKSGAFVDAARLQPIATATSVRVRNGETVTTDGPFAETKEQFGGYYLIDVPNLDAALTWAAKIPSARIGTIEVRPLWEMDESQG